jgi:hypothetical protein
MNYVIFAINVLFVGLALLGIVYNAVFPFFRVNMSWRLNRSPY